MPNQHSFYKTLRKIQADLKRYPGRWYIQPGFWVSVSHRVRVLRKFGPFYCRFLLPMDLLIGIIRRCLSDVILPSKAQIGSGLYLPHPQGIVIHADAVIGQSVAIFQQVTIGEWKGGVPTIGSHTVLYAGAKVFGDIRLGKHVQVGANAVVVDSFSDNQIAAGIPAKSIVSRSPPTK